MQADLVGLADNIIAQVVPLIASRARTTAPADTGSVGRITTASPEAYRHLVAGEVASRGNDTDKALLEYQAAVRIDSTFALAWLRLADTHWSRTRFLPARECANRAWGLRARLGIKDRMMLESRRLQLDGKLPAAMGVYLEMLSRWPDDRGILTTYAYALYWNWSFPEARQVTEQGLARYPDDEALGQLHCLALNRMERTAEAMEAAREYGRRHPGSSWRWDLLGEAQLTAGEADSAEAAFRQARKLDPNEFNLQTGLVRCAAVRGRPEQVETIIKGLLARSDLPPVQRVRLMRGTDVMGMGTLCAATGRLRKALEWVDATRRLDGSDDAKAQALTVRAAILVDAERPREVLAAARELGQIRTVAWAQGVARAWRLRGLIQADSLAAARAALTEFLAVNDRFAMLARYLPLSAAAGLSLAEGHPDSALATLARLEGYQQLRPPDLETRARALRALDRLPEAAVTLEGLLKRNGSRFIARYQLGQLYEEMGREADAAREYEAFLKAWADADPGCSQVEDARRRLAALRAGH